LEERHQAKTLKDNLARDELPPSAGIAGLGWNVPAAIDWHAPAIVGWMPLSPRRRRQQRRCQRQSHDEKSARGSNHDDTPDLVADARSTAIALIKDEERLAFSLSRS